KSGTQDNPAKGLGHRQNSTRNRSENLAGSRGRDHRSSRRRWQSGEERRPAGEDQTRLVQSVARTTGGSDQRGKGNKPSAKGDDGENGSGFETRARHVREEDNLDPGIQCRAGCVGRCEEYLRKFVTRN